MYRSGWFESPALPFKTYPEVFGRSLFALAGTEDASVPKQSSRTTAPYRGFPLERINWFGWADLVREYAPKPIPDVET
ncbi:hypothetical protein [Pseudaminobacter sp. NGMCC 1.201702]|uniref:hypothetical protein n=1 Tax=Pseudaminobacter sp. NGMCC 1.201702 TaxID=3391825 RepID=UPI0039F0EB6B